MAVLLGFVGGCGCLVVWFDCAFDFIIEVVVWLCCFGVCICCLVCFWGFVLVGVWFGFDCWFALMLFWLV